MTFRFSAPGVGVATSALCAVHCAALPLLAGASVGAPWLHSPWVEGPMVGVAALVGYGTLGSAFRRHGRPGPLVLLTLGLLLILGAHAFVPESLESVAAVAGAALLIGAQVLNRSCPAPCCSGARCAIPAEG